MSATGSEAMQFDINQLEAVLSQPDFVMEPGALPHVINYVKAGGKPQDVLEMLADNYCGYGQMATLVCRWLSSVDDEGAATASTGDKAGSAAAAAAAAAGAAASSLPHEPRDEFFYLKALARQKFNSERFAGVFSQAGGGGRPPAWLDKLIADRRGRQLIYELSAVHRSCLLLNFAIQKVLFQGHEDEVASVGSSLASFFSVFHRLFAGRLRAVALACSDSGTAASAGGTAGGTAAGGGSSAAAATLQAITRELVESCALSQHTYVHAQQLLKELGRHPNGAVYRRISQELEAHTAAQQPRAWDMMKWFVPVGSPASWVAAAGHVGRLLAAVPQLLTTDLVLLARLYAVRPPDVPPPLAPIQHPRLLHLLLSNIFTPGKVVSADILDAALDILALATVGRADHTSRQTGDPAMSSSHHLDGMEDGETDPALPGRLAETRSALQSALTVAAHASSKMTLADVASINEATRVPVACLGLLHYMGCHLSQREFHQEAACVTATPAYLRIMVAIAKQQPGMMHMVVELIETSLKSLGNQRNDTSQVFLDAAVVLMRDCHAVAEVTAMTEHWAEEADPSLVRFFIFQVLSSLSPPYSATFASWLLRLMVTSCVRRGRDGTQRNAALLEEFATAASAVRFVPPLGAKEHAFLQELSTNK